MEDEVQFRTVDFSESPTKDKIRSTLNIQGFAVVAILCEIQGGISVGPCLPDSGQAP